MSIVKHSIDLATAQAAIEVAAAKAAELGLKMSIAICDEAGYPKASVSMDGASISSIQIALDKAYTSAVSRRATHAWFEGIKNDPPLLHGIVHTPRLVVFGGGFPIKLDDQVVGSIGISGGHYSQDMECARAALAAIGAAEA